MQRARLAQTVTWPYGLTDKLPHHVVASSGATRTHPPHFFPNVTAQDISFSAGDPTCPKEVVVDQATVRTNLSDLLLKTDLSRYVL